MKVKLIIGLGNPDKKYQQTYHNIGHIFIDYLNNSPSFSLNKNIQIIKSAVFMNLSGDFLRKLLTKNKIKPTEILVIHDDSDIELGKYKFSFNRNSAGHKGVQSIIDQLKTKAIWRLRIGIREQLEKNQKMPNKRLKAGKIVLQKISKKHWDILQKETFPKITEDLMQTLRTNS